jgi:hypothetical protein
MLRLLPRRAASFAVSFSGTLSLLFVLACKDDGLPPEETALPPGDSAADDSGEPVDADGDGVPASEDCDDNDAAVSPSAEELCDGIDNNCDGAVDEGATDATAWYDDGDGDGYGAGEATLACAPEEGQVAQAEDCDDARAEINPGAAETDCADPTDYNCDGSTGFADADGDGFAACEECDDGAAAVNPDATEICDGLDNDCDGAVDPTSAEGAPSWYADGDGDSFGDATRPTVACEAPEGHVADATDCDDGVGAVNPDAVEVCDGVDNDCDGLIDPASADGAPTWYADTDGDGFGDVDAAVISCEAPSGAVADATDCDDAAPDTNPDGQEVCGGGDEDCDGLLDDEDGSVDLSTAATGYIDADGDGFGADLIVACELPSTAVSDDTDCDDADPSNYPSAAERCDGVDNDCDGVDDTIGYWPMDEGSGSTVYDAAGLGLSGAVTSGTWTTGKIGQAINFNGSSTTITMTPTGQGARPRRGPHGLGLGEARQAQQLKLGHRALRGHLGHHGLLRRHLLLGLLQDEHGLVQRRGDVEQRHHQLSDVLRARRRLAPPARHLEPRRHPGHLRRRCALGLGHERPQEPRQRRRAVPCGRRHQLRQPDALLRRRDRRGEALLLRGERRPGLRRLLRQLALLNDRDQGSFLSTTTRRGRPSRS